MTNSDHEMWQQLVQAEQQRMLASLVASAPPDGPRTTHYTDLPEDTSGGPLSREWNCYRREVGRLLAEGQEGRWVLIKDEQVVGIWDTEAEADALRLEQFLTVPILIKRICTPEPILRGGGYDRQWC